MAYRANPPEIGGSPSIILSGAQVVIVNQGDYVVEHSLAGREGGVTERIGAPQARVEIHGFIESSNPSITNPEELKARFEALVRDPPIVVYSTLSGGFFLRTAVFVEGVQIFQEEGHGYPFYRYIIRGVVSGGTIRTDLSGTAFAFMSGLTYSMDVPVMGRIFESYSMDVPIMGQINLANDPTPEINLRGQTMYINREGGDIQIRGQTHYINYNNDIQIRANTSFMSATRVS